MRSYNFSVLRINEGTKNITWINTDKINKNIKLLIENIVDVILDPKNESNRSIVKTFDPLILQKSITIVMNYFIGTEEYEKCAHLRKFEEILEEN